MTRRKDSARGRITVEDLRQVLAEDQDLLKVIVEGVLEQVLEAEMEEALQAGKSERTASRAGLSIGLLQPDVGDAGGQDCLTCTAGPARPLSHRGVRALSAERESTSGRHDGNVFTRGVHTEGQDRYGPG